MRSHYLYMPAQQPSGDRSIKLDLSVYLCPDLYLRSEKNLTRLRGRAGSSESSLFAKSHESWMIIRGKGDDNI